jgi:demethylmenaquinone methyltransferase/2-methoxy-6-polyprenyl-1,4-benzoquinol methylase
MVDKSPNRVRGMFSTIAPRYDRINHCLSLNIDRLWRRRTVRLVPAEAEAPVLDLCTGTGDLALAYFRATRGGVPIVGADFSHAMLRLAREKARRAGALKHVAFVEADALALPFAADSFQIVCVAFGLRNVADTDRGLREMVRVCRPEGTVAVLEFSMPRRQPWKGVYEWYFRRVLPRLGQALAKNASGAYNYLSESVGEFPAGESLAERLRAAGLTQVRFRPLLFGAATLYTGVK